MLILLAQSVPEPEAAIGWAERASKGGVAVICLVVAIAACVGVIFLLKKLLAKAEEFKDLEKSYRKTIEDKATADKADYDKRLEAAKGEAKERAGEVDKLMRERMAAERESDATLAKAVLVLEGNVKMLDKVERLLEEVRQSSVRVADGSAKMVDKIDRLIDELRQRRAS